MKYVIGVDLHGTLLDDKWEIKEELKDKLISVLVIKKFMYVLGMI